jgi:acetamidase/formamidase
MMNQGCDVRSTGVLQPASFGPGPAPEGLGTGAAFYVPAILETVRWGVLPNAQAKPILTVPSGSVVTFDTVSHEGMLEDQGRDPIRFFGQFGITRQEVLEDVQALAASDLEHDFLEDGPHIVIGPVEISGAEPGDLLKIDMVSFTPRVPYGVIASRHGKGALPGEFPEMPEPEVGASTANPELYHNVFRLVRLESEDNKLFCLLEDTNGRTLRFPAQPFQGTMGVAPSVSGRPNSILPGRYGGNIDLKYLTDGSALYLPVQVRGAMFFLGDPHFAQGNGEVGLSAVEGSLRATLRLTVLKFDQPGYSFKQQLKWPFAETPEYWIPIGLDPDLNEAMKIAVRNAICFLADTLGVDSATAMAYLSAAADFEVTQVVDRSKGIHGLIKKSQFATPR